MIALFKRLDKNCVELEQIWKNNIEWNAIPRANSQAKRESVSVLIAFTLGTLLVR